MTINAMETGTSPSPSHHHRTADTLEKGKGNDPKESPEKKKSKTTVETPVRSLLKSGHYAQPSMPGPT